jgi:putative DNA primase/helicase
MDKRAFALIPAARYAADWALPLRLLPTFAYPSPIQGNVTSAAFGRSRWMRQDFFTFKPSFKLLIAGNHKPSLRNVDEAIKRRFNLVPFAVTIPKGERDRDLAEKLKAEWPGILAWAIEGCLEWQRIGLCPPAAVVDATESYLADEDAIGRFLVQCCTTDDQDSIEEVKDLYTSWREWCGAGGEYVGSIKRFSQNLEARRFERCQHPSTRRSCFRGVRLLFRSNTMGAGHDGPDANEF